MLFELLFVLNFMAKVKAINGIFCKQIKEKTTANIYITSGVKR